MEKTKEIRQKAKEQKSLAMLGYLCRDEDGHLALHRDVPVIRVYKGAKMYSSSSNKIALRRVLFPQIKFSDGAVKVKVTIDIL